MTLVSNQLATYISLLALSTWNVYSFKYFLTNRYESGKNE